MDVALPPPNHHAVQFYGNDEGLFKTVSAFLSQGFVDGNPAILIATPAHASAILEHLKGRLIDVDRARRIGDFIVLDAQATLDRFMDGELPDAVRFERSVGRTIADLLKGRPERTLVRAYGEMVDVLWKQGKEVAAIRLEVLWNKLAQRYGFALLCGYAVGNFYRQTKAFEEVCRQHTHVVPVDAPFATPLRRVT
jgi:KaiC/GvpD/RAD55 family RecA-like ATPase